MELDSGAGPEAVSEDFAPDPDAAPGESDEPAAEEAEAPPAGGFDPPLKSVTYQPVPLSANDVILSCFTMGPLPQTLHEAGGASVDFCRISTCA